MKRWLEKYGEVISDANLTRRFVSAIARQENGKYNDVITLYRGQMILGNPCGIDNLCEFLAYIHVNKAGVTTSPVMKGLAGIAGCTHCGKMGHREKECWKKHPKNMQRQARGNNSPS